MFKLSFDTDNAAFEGDPRQEVILVLSRVAMAIEAGQATGKFQPVRDSNGNTIGTWKLNPQEARS